VDKKTIKETDMTIAAWFWILLIISALFTGFVTWPGSSGARWGFASWVLMSEVWTLGQDRVFEGLLDVRPAGYRFGIFGQPSAGRFFAKVLSTASVQSPSILRTSGFGPGLALAGFSNFATFFAIGALYR
jgi:hypothetical protein